MNSSVLYYILFGCLVGTVASFSGMGGGFLMVPVLLLLGYPSSRAVGTSLCAIFILCLSALALHGRLGNVDWKAGLLLGAGGVLGAQVGGRLLEGVPPLLFRKGVALALLGIAVVLFMKR